MLYIFHGTDSAKARQKAHELVAVLQKKRPDAEVFWINSESFSDGALKELVESQGLFSAKYIVVLDSVLEDARMHDAVIAYAKSMAQAEHVFVLLAGALAEKDSKLFAKVTEHIKTFDTHKAVKETFNTFAVSDALGARDKKKLWMLYMQAKEAGVSDEELHGIIWWQMKTIALAKRTTTAEQAGLKPFVWNKARTFARNYSDEDIRRALTELMELYHHARQGVFDFGVALEAWILK